MANEAVIEISTQELAAGEPELPATAPDSKQSPFLNQELSWLQFNQRVLDEALDQETPLLERVRFLSIFANNLDEFFMVRVSGLRGQLAAGVVESGPNGMTPAQQLMAIRESLTETLAQVADLWKSDLQPKLRRQDINVLEYSELQAGQIAALREYFAREVFPVLTPLAFDPAHPFPHISNLSLNLAVVVNDQDAREGFARVKVADGLPRLVPVPGEASFQASLRPPGLGASVNIEAGGNFVWIEDLIAANLDMLFPGLEVVDANPFRITRDADFDMKSDGASDLLTNIEELIEMRQWGAVVRLELGHNTPDRIQDILMRNLDLTPDQVYLSQEHLGLASLSDLCRIDRPGLKFTPHVPHLPAMLANRSSIFDVITEEGLILYHPYDSFTPVVDLIREAAHDPQVLAIKQTLYRVGANTPIVEALKEARQNGKQVAVLLEIQARFDEENNIAWARQLEDEGVHVVYGVLGLKTHAKMSLVVRREAGGLTRYVHLGTGNYNTVTSRLYTDISFLTKDPDICADVGEVFNSLTGFSTQDHFRKLLVAPRSLRTEIISRIDREAARQRDRGDGYIAMKMNSLVDRPCIQALYKASQAGVRIDLQVRGMCCLVPGVPGLSETINVTSLVGRFLEHARIFYFRNGGDQDELFLGSADLMPRNLDRRVETVFPIESPRLRGRILHEILETHLHDTAQARKLLPDGTYERILPDGAEPLNSQEWMMANWRGGT